MQNIKERPFLIRKISFDKVEGLISLARTLDRISNRAGE